MNSLCVALLCALATGPVQTNEAYVGYGVGVFNDADSYIGQMKVAEVGYRYFLLDGIYWQNKIGYWGDASNDKTRSSSGYGASGLGMELSLQPLELRSSVSLAMVTTPDSQLGSAFPQFNEELYAGLRDRMGDGFGFQYEHISCGPFCSPNLGRDFIILQLSRKW